MNIPEKHRLLFRNTYESLRGRIHSNGYTPTSVTGTYNGMFTRDASIQIMAHTACGDFDAARRMLAYIFSYCILWYDCRVCCVNIVEEGNHHAVHR